MVNRADFYNKVRTSFGRLMQSQVEGFEAILNAWEVSGLTDLRWLAYMFSTAYHETAATMQPIQEYGNKEYFVRRYWMNKKIRTALGNLSPQDAINFSGKGLVQLTGRYNFKKMSKLLGIDLVNNPDLALQMDVSVKIMFEGMTTGKSFAGDFTGKHLGNYFNKTKEDWINARRIINGLDKAKLIAGYARKFYAALA